MKKLALLSTMICFLLPGIWGQSAPAMLEFSYDKPYTYELINGSYKVQAKVIGVRSADELMVHFNGDNLLLEEQENQDLQIWLPLIGDPGVLNP